MEKKIDDSEFFTEIKDIHEMLVKNGWKKEKNTITHNEVHVYYVKSKLGLSISFGCDEDLKRDLLD